MVFQLKESILIISVYCVQREEMGPASASASWSEHCIDWACLPVQRGSFLGSSDCHKEPTLLTDKRGELRDIISVIFPKTSVHPEKLS